MRKLNHLILRTIAAISTLTATTGGTACGGTIPPLTPNQRMSYAVYKVDRDIGLYQCTQECMKAVDCLSVTYRRHQLSCTFNFENKASAPSNYHSASDTLYVDKTDLVEDHACPSHATSVTLRSGRQHCMITACGQAPVVPLTDLITGRSVPVGTTVYPTCSGLYTGSPRITCLASGLWSAPTDQCSIPCGPLPDVPQATSDVSVTDTVVATYTCHAEYSPVGQATVTCNTATNTWSRAVFTCFLGCTNAPDPPSSSNARRTGSGNVAYGESVVYACNTGYYKTWGSETVDCRKGEGWAQPTLVCSPTGCSTPPLSVNSYNLLQYSCLTYKCKAGYECKYDPRNREDIACGSKGEWSTIPENNCSP